MRRRERDGHEQVFALGLFRDDALVAHGVRLPDGLFKPALNRDFPVFYDPFDVVRIHLVAAEPNGVFGGSFEGAVCLRHHVVGKQPARLAHVELVRPVPGLRKFVCLRAVGGNPLTQAGGDGRVVRQKIHEALLVVHVVLEDLFALLIGAFRPSEVRAHMVYRNRAGVVAVALVYLYGAVAVAQIPEVGGRGGIDVALEQLVPLGAVVVGLGPRHLFPLFCRPHSETVGLQFFVALADIVGLRAAHALYEAARRVARNFVRVHGEPGYVAVL